MGNNFLKLSIVLCLILFIVACKVMNQDELYGTFIADYSLAKEKLILNQDGTFIQEVTLKSTSRVDSTKGT